MKIKIPLLKLAGILSTSVLIVASVAPDTLRIPIFMRPWIFLFTITWAMLGVFGINL